MPSRALSVLRILAVCGALLWLKFGRSTSEVAAPQASAPERSIEALRSENLRLRRAMAYLAVLGQQCAGTAPAAARAGVAEHDAEDGWQPPPAPLLLPDLPEPVLLQVSERVEVVPGGPMTPITY